MKDQYQKNPSMQWGPVSEKGATTALRTKLNWKDCERDKINFWLKQVTVCHKCLVDCLTN